MLEEKDDTILARWLSGEITPGDRKRLEESEGYGDYVEIVQGMDRFLKPSFAGNALRERIQGQIDSPRKSRVIRFRPWHYGVAASILVLFSLAFFFNEIHYDTLPGEQLTVSLPDGTQVHLNADTQIKRSRFFWSMDKKVDLVRGEAFFEVVRGDGFEVSTPQGIVRVLGTRFNIKNRGGSFEVACYQGKIEFVAEDTGVGTQLGAGQKLKEVNGSFEAGTLERDLPPWTRGESVFENIPLSVVLLELEAQYGISFQSNGLATDEKYTGGFVHGNLDRALTTVLLPMGIQYRMAPDQRTVLLSLMD